MLDDNTHYGLLNTFGDNPGLTQRDLAKYLGIGLGKMNFCPSAPVAKGNLKVYIFRNSDNKLFMLLYPFWSEVAGKRA